MMAPRPSSRRKMAIKPTTAPAVIKAMFRPSTLNFSPISVLASSISFLMRFLMSVCRSPTSEMNRSFFGESIVILAFMSTPCMQRAALYCFLLKVGHFGRTAIQGRLGEWLQSYPERRCLSAQGVVRSSAALSDGGGDDGVLVPCSRGANRRETTAAHDTDGIAHSQKLREIAADKEDRFAFGGQFADQLINLRFAADVDTASWFV